MEWSSKKVLELVSSYHNYPILWDSKHPKFRDRNSRKNANIQLALDVGCPINEVKSKISKLRGQFQREFLKVKKSSRDGNGKETAYVPKWFAYNGMLACMGGHEDNFNTFKIEESQFNVESVCSENGDPADEVRDVESIQYNNTVIETAKQTKKTNKQNDGMKIPENYSTSNSTICNNVIETAKQTKRTNKQNDGMIIPENYSTSNSTIRASERQEDEFSDYGRYIANELRQLRSDPHALACVKYEFNNILFKAAMGEYSKSALGADELSSALGPDELS